MLENQVEEISLDKSIILSAEMISNKSSLHGS